MTTHGRQTDGVDTTCAWYFDVVYAAVYLRRLTDKWTALLFNRADSRTAVCHGAVDRLPDHCVLTSVAMPPSVRSDPAMRCTCHLSRSPVRGLVNSHGMERISVFMYEPSTDSNRAGLEKSRFLVKVFRF